MIISISISELLQNICFSICIIYLPKVYQYTREVGFPINFVFEKLDYDNLIVTLTIYCNIRDIERKTIVFYFV